MKTIGYDHWLTRCIVSLVLGLVWSIFFLWLNQYITFDFKELAKTIISLLGSVGVLAIILRVYLLYKEIREMDFSVFPKKKKETVASEREDFLNIWFHNKKSYIPDLFIFIVLFVIVTVGEIHIEDKEINYMVTSMALTTFAIYAFLLSLSINSLAEPLVKFKSYLTKQIAIEGKRAELIEKLIVVRDAYKNKAYSENKKVNLKELLKEKIDDKNDEDNI